MVVVHQPAPEFEPATVYTEQPGPKRYVKKSTKTRVVISQPYSDVWAYEHHWQVGLSACCDDCGQCCYAWFCYCCFLGRLFKRTGDCVMMFCVPGALWAMRSKLRTGFRIKGSLCRDCVATCCCSCCAAIQMSKELDLQEL